MKKSEIKKLDVIWAKAVKEKGGYKCESCLEEGLRMEAAHIRGRRARNTRWGAFINGKYDLCGMCLCSECHKQYDEHREREAFIRRVVIGEERYSVINSLSEVVAKHQVYEEILKNITGIV